MANLSKMGTVPKIKLAILASGEGSNLDAIIEACQDKNYPAYIGVVVSDKKDAPALKKAQAQGLPAIFIDPKLYDSREDYDQMLATTLKQYQVDLVVLAGFMRILSSIFINAFKKKAINIHPSLLPKYKGMNAVKQALASGDSETGCTVHYIDEGVDTGPIIEQSKVAIQKGDTEETLHKRIKAEEHLLYPIVIEALSKKMLKS